MFSLLLVILSLLLVIIVIGFFTFKVYRSQSRIIKTLNIKIEESSEIIFKSYILLKPNWFGMTLEPSILVVVPDKLIIYDLKKGKIIIPKDKIKKITTTGWASPFVVNPSNLELTDGTKYRLMGFRRGDILIGRNGASTADSNRLTESLARKLNRWLENKS